MLSLRIPDFDPDLVYQSRQLVDWRRVGPRWYIIYNQDKACSIKRYGEKIVFYCNEEDFFNIWYKQLSLDLNLLTLPHKLLGVDTLMTDMLSTHYKLRPIRMPLEEAIIKSCLLVKDIQGYQFRDILGSLYSVCGTMRAYTIPNMGRIQWTACPTLRTLQCFRGTMYSVLFPRDAENLICQIGDMVNSDELRLAEALPAEEAEGWLRQHIPVLTEEQIDHIMLSVYCDISRCPQYYLSEPAQSLYGISAQSLKEWFEPETKDIIGMIGLACSAANTEGRLFVNKLIQKNGSCLLTKLKKEAKKWA